MGIKRYKQLYNSADAATSSWIPLDVRYEENSQRAIIVSLVSGDTVTIEGTVWDVKGIDKSGLDDLTASDITTLKEYTESEEDVLEGPWTYIRIVKAGTAGVAKVTGFI